MNSVAQIGDLTPGALPPQEPSPPTPIGVNLTAAAVFVGAVRGMPSGTPRGRPARFVSRDSEKQPLGQASAHPGRPHGVPNGIPWTAPTSFPNTAPTLARNLLGQSDAVRLFARGGKTMKKLHSIRTVTLGAAAGLLVLGLAATATALQDQTPLTLT